MADITMCASIDCPLAKKCYRKLAVKNLYYQSYADFKPDDGECAGYTPTSAKQTTTDGDTDSDN